MERSKSIISIVVGLAAILIIWRIGFYPPPAPEQAEDMFETETEVAAEPSAPGEVNEPMVSLDDRPGRPGRADRPVRMFTPSDSEPGDPNDPNGPMEFVNLKSVEMKSIIQKLADWTGKVILPTDEALKQKVTIYAPDKLPRSEALRVIYSALRLKGFIVEESDGTLFLKPITDAKLGRVPVIPADEPLAMIENKDQIVQKFFELTSYNPSEMGTIIQPLVGEHGYVSVDEVGGTLMVIDSVANLMRLERIIQEFDVPGTEQSVTDIIEVRYGDPSEIVQMLNILLGETQGISTLRYNRYRDSRDRGSSRSSSSRSSSERSSGSTAKKTTSKDDTATSVVVGTTRGPVILIPEPRRKWIIAKASAEDLKQIREWVNKLDMEEPVGSEYEVVQLRYADPRQVEDSVGDGFRDLPGMEFLPSVLIEPLTDTRQVIIFGREDLREIVKKMIAEVDVPPGQFDTAHIKLKHADPDMVKEKLDELYQQGMSGSSSRYGYGGYNPYSRGRSSSSRTSEMVKVVSYATLKEITVIASPENMIEIKKRIEEWDVPLDVESVKPRIIELRNCDPVEMANLLTSLFSEGSSSSSSSRGFSMYRGMFASQLVDQQKIIGPLYGQLTFEEVPGTKKIIVISKIPEAYAVIEQLVMELDKAEMAEIPKVVTLKYADPEELCEILNAMFAEAGTSASLSRTAVGLGEYSMSEETNTASDQNTSQDQYTPWWAGSGARRTVDEEMPISNVIGRIRFVPDSRTKSILILSPPEFMPKIEQLVEELDVPGKQVMVKAIIVQIEHKSMTSLGVQFAPYGSETLAFGTYDENTVTVRNQLEYMYNRGSFTFSAFADVTAMLDFLVTETRAKLLNEQTLWTEDNEEASFFKGDKVAFFGETTSSPDVGITQSVEFDRVGMTLAVRPSITPENRVDMIINILISQLTTEEENGQPVRTEMETLTNMIVADGETVMLGGILVQVDRIVKKKVPLLGDIPIIGELLFAHNEINAANNELIVFITPYVIDDPDVVLPATREQMERPKEKLEKVREEIDTTVEALKERTEALK
ncbi:MAG: secretin N-terminal domain-containing protein [Planctomycetota bacterium]|jgi:general secretion pathway protein D